MRNANTPLLVLIAVLLSQPARAATVTTTVDDGPGSLRNAIANAVPGETITFASGGTITLTSGELLIDKNLIITGPGASNLVIQRSTDTGTPDFRIFDVLSGNVTVSGLTVSNGRDDVGGGIYSSADLTLNDCAVTNNFGNESGGGIFNTSMMIISNCVVRGNSAAGDTGDGFGGGIYNAGTATAVSSTFSNNSVTSGTGGGFGGGVCNDGTLTLTGSVINGNSANGGPDNGGGFGGGINNGFGTLYLDQSTVSGNVARGGAGSDGGLGEGGGVLNGFGTVSVDRSTVSGNSAVGGAGGSGGSSEGGGVANDEGTMYVFNSTVSGNFSSGGAGTASRGSPYGGGIFNGFGSLILTNSTITANVVPSGFLEDGGGIFNLLGGVVLKNTIVAANTATVDLFNGEDPDPFYDGYTISDGFNLFGSTKGLVYPGSGDQFNITAAALRLGPLQNNGGPTFTHALLCGSPAINAGDNAGAPATDQRGYARIVGGVIDIGAYEGNNTAPTISCPAPTTLDYVAPADPVATVSVNVSDADGDPLVVVWTVDGTAYQTNLVAAGGPPTAASVTFTAAFGGGSHSIGVRVIDSTQCEATCATTVFVNQVEDPPLPPVQTCGNPSLGSAADFGVLQLGGGSIAITLGGVDGDVGVGPNGKFSISGSSFVSETLYLSPGDSFSRSGRGTIGSIVKNANLSQPISDALATAATDAVLPCTQAFTKWDTKGTVSGTAGDNVICVGSVAMQAGDHIALTGPVGAKFIINVKGSFSMSGGSTIRVAGGVRSQDVIYNIIGSGPTVVLNGGSAVDGSLLAAKRGVSLSIGITKGQVIAGGNIVIQSGASVRCPDSL